MVKKKRDLNLDLIRCVAVFCVLSVHFFLNSGYYSETIHGKKIYIGTIMRTMFMVCVPLFLLLTGYLMNSKVLSKKYYRGIHKTLCIYILSVVAILIYRVAVTKEKFTVYTIFTNFTSFSQYSWYIEMYIGLFLLIPFLNILYNNLSTKKDKKILLATLIFLTSIPSAVNTWDFSSIETFLHPAQSEAFTLLIPDWWMGIYPITYYFIGAYIHEYKKEIKISLKLNFLLIVTCVLIFASYCYWHSYGRTFIWGSWCSWGGFTNLIDSVLVFLFLLRLDLSRISNILKEGITYISEISLGVYLVSWIFDKHNYPKLIESIQHMPDRIPFYFFIVPLNFVCACLVAGAIDFIFKAFMNMRERGGVIVIDSREILFDM